MFKLAVAILLIPRCAGGGLGVWVCLLVYGLLGWVGLGWFGMVIGGFVLRGDEEIGGFGDGNGNGGLGS